MPSGATHDRITLWSLPWVGGLSFLILEQIHLTTIIAASFLFSGLMFGPDLDIYSVQFKRWGKLRWLWLPYQRCLSHRSKLSHGPIIGTILRILYLLAIVSVAVVGGVAIAQLIWGFNWNWQQFVSQLINKILENYPYEAIALLIGLELGSMSHYLSDWLTSAYQRSQKKAYRRSKPKLSKSKKLNKKSLRRRKS